MRLTAGASRCWRTLLHAVGSFPILLLQLALRTARWAAAAVVVLALGTVVLFSALWLWRRTPNLPPFVWAGLLAALAAHIAGVFLRAISLSLEALGNSLNPYPPRTVQASRLRWAVPDYYRPVYAPPYAPQHPGDP